MEEDEVPEQSEEPESSSETEDNPSVFEESIMDVLASIKDEQASMRAQMISMKDSISQFVDAGGVIREEDNVPPLEDDDDYEFTPIEELDLTL